MKAGKLKPLSHLDIFKQEQDFISRLTLFYLGNIPEWSECGGTEKIMNVPSESIISSFSGQWPLDIPAVASRFHHLLGSRPQGTPKCS